MHPGTVNTKLLDAGWGAYGMKVAEATDTFYLATEERFTDPGEWPKYYRKLEKESTSA